MYRRDQEQIVALRLPNMGLKMSLSSSGVCSVLGVLWCFGHKLSFIHPN